MVALPTSPQPPVNEAPLSDNGQHTQAWSQYHQKMSDTLKALPTEVRTGTKTNDNAAAGMIGEYITANGGPFTLGGIANIASISLTAGDWDVSGRITFTPAPTTRPVQFSAGLSAASGAFSTPANGFSTAFTAGVPATIDAGVARFSLAGTTTIYLVGLASFTVSSMTASGIIAARRAR